MKKINIKGPIIPNAYKWFYDYFQMDSTSPNDVLKYLDDSDLPNPEAIEVYINSPGGVIEAGTEIYTMIKKYKGDSKIFIVGEAHSAASMIAMASDHVEMAPTALMMIHNVSISSAGGNHTDLERTAEILKIADNAIANAYVDKTGLSKEEVLNLMEKETWFTAQMAKEKGFIDKIMFENEEENTNLALTASTFKLPSAEQMEKIKTMITEQSIKNESAFLMSKIKFLRLKER